MSALRKIREISPAAADVLGTQPTVRIQTLVRGDLFGSDQTLLERVRQKGGLRVVAEDNSGFAPSRGATTKEKANVIVVFSPISFYLPDDYMIEIGVAMDNVAEYLPGGAPVILVLMHLTDDDDCPDIIRSLGSDPRLPSWHIEDFVNVLYWPSGLLTCPLNERAVAQLHSTLLKHSTGEARAQPTVRIHTLVRGDLFGSDQTLLERVRQKGGLRVVAEDPWATTKEKANVIVVFSPISFYLPDDYMIEIEVAMDNVAEYLPGGAPVILVLMHLTDDNDCPDIIRSLDGDPRLPSWHIEDFVNVLYWPSGLLTCPLNERAVAQLHSALLKHSRAVSPAAASGSSSSSS